MRDITYCLSCKKDTRNIDSKIVKTKNNKRVMSSKCSICNNKKSTFTAGPTAEPNALARSSLERISQRYGLFDNLGLNPPQNTMKNALWNVFG